MDLVEFEKLWVRTECFMQNQMYSLVALKGQKSKEKTNLGIPFLKFLI